MTWTVTITAPNGAKGNFTSADTHGLVDSLVEFVRSVNDNDPKPLDPDKPSGTQDRKTPAKDK